ncbi:MAG: cyclic nucleotide-binding domain-containing protein [Deltaproteobacteria bacterium]|nr:cyclic nucleotide-binding domain-containing protein [Deltaproteobacteria bacterium]
MTQDATEALAKTPLFGSLSETHLSRLASLTTIEDHKRGDVVFSEGDLGDRFYIILTGRVRISRQIPGIGEEALAVLNPGSCFGEMALIEDEPRSADAIVHESVTLLVLGKRDLEDLLFVDRDAAYEILWAFVRTLSSRLRETSNKLTFLTVSSKFG